MFYQENNYKLFIPQEAWKDVTNVNSSTNWALFGYEGQTNILTLVGKGEDGIDELIEDLNPSKIMYGFLRVEDPKTSLPKYVILNWQVCIVYQAFTILQSQNK